MGVLSPQFGSLIPSPKKQTLVDNYLNFADGGGNDFAQQYLPEIYEAEVERYGNRTIGGFLRMVGAEMPMMSDQIVWSEQNRLHISYDNVSCTGSGVNNGSRLTIVGADNAVFINQTVVIMDPNDPSFTVKAIVSDSGAQTGSALGALVLDVVPYTRAKVNANIAGGMTGLKMFVYGSEFGKGSTLDNSTGQSVEPQLSVFSNKPIIIRDRYAVSGSDTAQIGWVEVAAEDGTSGYLWYLQSEHETRQRFEDYLEMSMIESVKSTQAASPGGGTEGLFAALGSRGNVYTDLSTELQTNMDGFDTILKQLDKNGAIEENMLYIDKSLSLAIDDALAAKNSYGTGGTSYGVFNNSEEMALNLGFSGFRRGGYDFYKTDWKYLNDFGTRGLFTDIEGVIIPAGTSTVYDQELGQNIKRPFLHVRYRASETDDRKMKTWITGSVGGSYTTTTDEMRVSFLSERCLIVQGANNFFLLKD